MSFRGLVATVCCSLVAGCVHPGSWSGTSCQTIGGQTRCYDLTSLKQQPGGPPTPDDEARTFASERPPNPPDGPIQDPPPSGVYVWPSSVYVVTPGPVQQPR
jgi:hypothetical protein